MKERNPLTTTAAKGSETVQSGGRPGSSIPGTSQSTICSKSLLDGEDRQEKAYGNEGEAQTTSPSICFYYIIIHAAL